jgi:hypothetical protein
MRLAIVLTLVCSPFTAWAQDPKFEYGKKEEVKDPKAVEWKVSAQASLLITTGNSRTTTASGGAAASRRSGPHKLQLEVAGSYARASFLVPSDFNNNGTIDDENELASELRVTTKSLLAKARYDIFFTEHNSAFATARIGGDAPAGKDLVAGGQAGYSRQLYKTGQHELVGEAGYDFSYEDYTAADAESVSIHSARLFAGYTGLLTKDTGVTASVEVLLNLNSETNPIMGEPEIGPFEDTRATAKVSLTTKLVSVISFRFAFMARYDQAPAPLPALTLPFAADFHPLAETLDTTTELALIVNFL